MANPEVPVRNLRVWVGTSGQLAYGVGSLDGH